MQKSGGGRGIFFTAFLSIVVAGQATSSLAQSVSYSSTGVLCLNGLDPNFRSDLQRIQDDIKTKSVLTAETKAAILPRINEFTPSDFWQLREKLLKLGGDYKNHLATEFGADIDSAKRMQSLEAELKKKVPVFAKLFGWAGSRVNSGAISFNEPAPLDFVPQVDLRNRPDCVEVPFAFLIRDERAPFLYSVESIFDKDLGALVADGLERALFLGHEGLTVLGATVRAPQKSAITFLNTAFFGKSYWADRSGGQYFPVHDAKAIHNDIITMVGEYPLILKNFLGDESVLLRSAPGATSRTLSYVDLKTQQQGLFRACLERRSKNAPIYMAQVLKCRGLAEDFQDLQGLSPESAFLYLAEYRIGYSEQLQEANFSQIVHDRDTPEIETLLDLKGALDAGELAEQRAKVQRLCAHITKAQEAFHQRRRLTGLNNVRTDAIGKIYALATQYCTEDRE